MALIHSQNKTSLNAFYGSIRNQGHGRQRKACLLEGHRLKGEMDMYLTKGNRQGPRRGPFPADVLSVKTETSTHQRQMTKHYSWAANIGASVFFHYRWLRVWFIVAEEDGNQTGLFLNLNATAYQFGQVM